MASHPQQLIAQEMKKPLTTLTMLIFACHVAASSNLLHPVILVPGAGGNQLEARLTKDYKASSFLCNRWYPVAKKAGGWFRLWFDPSVLVGPFTDCFARRMSLRYDKEADDYRNADGVETRVPHFGSTRSLLYLDPSLKQVTAYMSKLVETLEILGYVDEETLFGAPYDFRYGLAAEGRPSKVGTKFLKDLKELIERASALNSGKPVILLSHSLGGMFVLQFLDRTPRSWRDKYVKHFIAMSAPWGGTVEEMLTFASGTTLGVPLVDPLLVRGEQRSSESNLWLLPNPRIFRGASPLVVTKNASYSARDMAEFLLRIGYPEGVRPYETRIAPLMEKLPAPGVPVTCVVGSNVETVAKLVYKGVGFDERPEVVYGDGDGTVNLVSLLALESVWAGEDEQPLDVVRLSGVSHTGMLKDERALREIGGLISSVNSELVCDIQCILNPSKKKVL